MANPWGRKTNTSSSNPWTAKPTHSQPTYNVPTAERQITSFGRTLGTIGQASDTMRRVQEEEAEKKRKANEQFLTKNIIPERREMPSLELPKDDGLTEERLLLARKEPEYKAKVQETKEFNKERKEIAKQTIQDINKQIARLDPNSPSYQQNIKMLVDRQMEAEGIVNAAGAGVFSGLVPFGEQLINKQSMEAARKEPEYAPSKVVGKIGQQAAIYNTLGPVLKGTSIGQKVLGGAGASPWRQIAGQQGADLLVDTIIQAPQEIFRGIQENQTIGEQAKNFAINRTLDVLMNAVMGGVTSDFKKAFETPEVQQAFKQVNIDPETVVKAVDSGDNEILNSIKIELDNSFKNMDSSFKQDTPTLEIPTKQEVNPWGDKPALSERIKQVGEPTKVMDSKFESDIEIDFPSSKMAFASQETDLPELVLKERGFSKNVATDINRNDAVRQSFEDNPDFYKQLDNKTTLGSAEQRFAQGYENALKDLELTKNELRADNVPLAKMLADEAARRGDMETARRVISDMAESLTNAGQFSQAAKILRDSNDPSAILLFIEKEIKKLNTKGSKQLGRKWNEISLLDNEKQMIDDFVKASSDQDKEVLFEQLFDSISTRIPTTNMEKFDSWRRMAMLMNPKTHVRNIVGNGVMGAMKKLSDTVEVGAQKLLLKEADRTRVLKPSAEAKQVAAEYFEANKKDLLEGGRWELFGIKSPFAEKQIFKTKWLETLNNVSKNTLEGEDAFFMKRHFINDLANTMTAKGLKEPNQEAINYALRRAQEATFREANSLADAVNKLKSAKGWGKLVDALVPFVKTPANIAMTGKNYSPIGLVEGIGGLFKGTDPQKAVETLSKGLVGTGVMAVGAWAAKNGFVRGDYKGGKSEAINQLTGTLPNSIITPAGSYTIDWLQPTAIPFFMGVALSEELMNNEDANAVDAGISALIAGGDSLFNQSLLSGFKDLLGGNGSTTSKIAELPIDYITQAFPTIAGQLARSMDPVKRQVDYSGSALKSSLQQLQSRTPVASESLPAKRDILGNVQTYGEKGLLNTFNQFLNPGTFKERTKDPIALELEKVVKSEGEKILPNLQTYNFSDKGVKYELDNTEVSEFQRIQGEKAKELLKKITESSSYKGLSNAQKADKFENAFDKAYNEAKKELLKQMLAKQKER